MGLLSGPANVTRFRVVTRPEEPDFDAQRFTEIPAGSELRESVGFVPFELEAPYRVGSARLAFRLRIDRRRPDPTVVKERLREVERAEREASGAPFVRAERRRELRAAIEEELVVDATPRSTIVEGCIDDQILYAGSVTNAHLSAMVEALRRVGVLLEPKTPWLDRGEPEVFSEIVPTRDPGQSVLGCRFLRALVGDPEVVIEPESGAVRLQTIDTRVGLDGAVLADLMRYLDRGGVEVTSARLVIGEARMRFDALGWRLASLRFRTEPHDHWSDQLDERLEYFAALFELLDGKYDTLRSRFGELP